MLDTIIIKFFIIFLLNTVLKIQLTYSKNTIKIKYLKYSKRTWKREVKTLCIIDENVIITWKRYIEYSLYLQHENLDAHNRDGFYNACFNI